MRSRLIGTLSVSEIGLGCNNFGRRLDYEESRTVVSEALRQGVTFFDTADRYGYGEHPYSGLGVSEEFLGRALGTSRTDVVVATKFGNPMSETDPSMAGASPKWVKSACEQSLSRLGTDYIDLYQIHQPDPTVPIEETLGALTSLVEEGKIRAIGCSNFSADELAEADDCASELGTSRFESIQNEYSLLVRDVENAVLAECDARDIAFVPYFPLAGGLLTGKYRLGREAPEGSRLSWWTPRPHLDTSDRALTRVESLIDFAASRGHTILELAFAWLLANPLVASVVAGATSPDQVRSNTATTSWKLTPDDLREVGTI